MIGIIIAAAVLFALFSAVTMRAIYWARYPFATKRKRRKRERTCKTCKHQPRCDAFFERRYRKLGIKEPEAWKTWACKMYQERACEK